MEKGKLSVIPGGKDIARTTLIVLMIQTLGLFLLAYGLSELLLMIQNLDLALFRLRQMLQQKHTDGAVFIFTETAQVTPETRHTDVSSQTETNHIKPENT